MANMVPKRRLLSGVVALAVVGLAGACSSSSKPASTSATSTGGASPASTASAGTAAAPIKVGIVCSCSGVFGTDYIGVDQVYDAWVKTVNASGGINGHMVQTVLEDDAGVPGTAVTKVQALVSDHIDAMVDMSTVDSAWATTAQQAQIPVVGQNAIGGPMNTNPDFYPEGTTNDTTSYAVVAAAKASGASDMGAVYCAEAAVCAQIVPVLKSAAKSLGVSVVYSGEIAATAPNYTAQCLSAQQAHTQALYIGDSPTVVVRMAKDCVTQSYSPSFVTSGEGFYPGELTAPGLSKDLWSEYSDFPAFATPTPTFVQSMLDAVNQYYPQLPKNTTGVWSQLPTESWVSGLLLEDAVKAGGLSSTGTPSAAEVTKGLESLKGDTLGGWAPPLTFAAGQPHQIQCWFIGKVTNGVFTAVNGGKYTCKNGS
jgi:branched-chain amino acid transport system substrate-binding protein